MDFWQSYESQVGDTAWVALHSDNTISNGMGDTTFDGKTVKRLMKNNNLMWGVGVQDNDDNFYLFNDNYVGSHFYGSQVIGVNGYDFMASTGMPAGVTEQSRLASTALTSVTARSFSGQMATFTARSLLRPRETGTPPKDSTTLAAPTRPQ